MCSNGTVLRRGRVWCVSFATSHKILGNNHTISSIQLRRNDNAISCSQSLDCHKTDKDKVERSECGRSFQATFTRKTETITNTTAGRCRRGGRGNRTQSRQPKCQIVEVGARRKGTDLRTIAPASDIRLVQAKDRSTWARQG